MLAKIISSAMDYSEYSPLFPNPVKCFSEIASTATNETINRLPWNGLSQWWRETWIMHYICVHVRLNDIYCAIALSVFLTAIRLCLDSALLKRIPQWFVIPKRDADKFPASAWKVLIYSILWIWALSIIYKENIFFRLVGMFEECEPGHTAHSSLYWLYMTELGLYIHSIYATLYLEAVQKDYVVLLIHHFVTIGLIGYSHSIGFHKIGLTVLFLHDIGDIWLELSKCLFYFKTQKGVNHALPEILANCSFAVFTLQWILFRMYWFPTKAIYSAAHVSMTYYPNGPFYLPFLVLLVSLFLMHCYWFVFIVQLVVKVIKGKEIGDNRDIDEPRDIKDKIE